MFAASTTQIERRVTAQSAVADNWLIAAAIIVIACDILISSRFYVFAFGVESRPVFFAIALVVIFCCAMVTVVQRDVAALLVFLGILLFFVLYMFVFSIKSGREINWNAMAQTYGLLGFIVFYEIGKRQLFPRLLRVMYFMLTIYLVWYVVKAILYYAGLIDVIEPPEIYTVLHDQERGQRLFLAGALATFVWTYALTHMQERFTLGHFLAFALAVSASALSISRVFLAVNLAVFLLYFFTRNIRLVSIATFAMYILVALYLMTGIFDTSINPFDISSTDTTTLYRKYEYDVMVTHIHEDPVIGIGLYDSNAGISYYVGRMLFFPSDIGIIGVWMMFGLIGVLLLGFLPAYICCFPRASIHNTGMSNADLRTLSLTGCCIGLYASTSMNMINGPDSLIFSLILAHFLISIFYGSKRFYG
jgi:hypothetical protein